MTDGPVCITCGDIALEMRVLEAADEDGLAVCATETGETSSVDVSLVEDLTPGDSVLVHACVALRRLEAATA